MARAWDGLVQRDWAAARADLRAARQIGGSVAKTALYVVSILVFGAARLPTLRLIANRLHGVLQRSP